MIAIDSETNTIYYSRGNATKETFNKIAFRYPIYNFEEEKEEDYEFQLTDKINFKVYEKKGYKKQEVINKEYTISDLYLEPTTTPEIILTTEDTDKFAIVNKKKTYWYDIVLNDDTTILGYDDEGAKKFIVYPEVIEREGE